MNDTEILTQLAGTDAYAPGTEMPSSAWSRETARSEIERRMGMEPRETTDQPNITSSQQQQDAAPPPSAPDQVITAPQQRTSPGRRRPLLVGVGVVAAVVFVGAAALGIVAVVGDDATSPVAAPTVTAAPVTTQPPTTTTVPGFTVDEALAVSDSYFAAYEAGDVDAMLALFAPDLVLIFPEGGSSSLEQYEQLFTWKLAEGTVFTPSECDATTVEDAGITVVCEYAHHPYSAIVVGAPATAFTLTMIVTPNGSISWLSDRSHSPAFVTDGPLRSWVEQNYPGDGVKVRCCFWDSVEDARAAGLIRAQYAEEWATYLEANGCTYTDGC